jgi:hypothetical protein
LIYLLLVHRLGPFIDPTDPVGSHGHRHAKTRLPCDELAGNRACRHWARTKLDAPGRRGQHSLAEESVGGRLRSRASADARWRAGMPLVARTTYTGSSMAIGKYVQGETSRARHWPWHGRWPCSFLRVTVHVPLHWSGSLYIAMVSVWHTSSPHRHASRLA